MSNMVEQPNQEQLRPPALSVVATGRDAGQSAGEPDVAATTDTAERLRAQLRESHDMIENLQVALGTNRQIGVAIGILMARHGYTQETAFDQLRLVSQRAHRKLRDVASDVVFTGDLPPAV